MLWLISLCCDNFVVFQLGMEQNTYLPIRYYHDTWVPWVPIFLKNLDYKSIAVQYCCILIFVFNSRPW